MINFFWIGQLSEMETFCLQSHLKQGHSCRIWSYQNIGPVPSGVETANARDILPESEVFTYQNGEGKGSYSACSNLFRYKLLKELGGWWSDLDVIALKPFDFADSFVFASERKKNGSACPATCVMKSPPNAAIFEDCWRGANAVDKRTVQWGTIGPKMLTKHVFRHGLESCVKPTHFFCPVDWFIAEKDPPIHREIDLSQSYAVHLWHEMWRRKGINKNDSFPGSLYEKLKHALLSTS